MGILRDAYGIQINPVSNITHTDLLGTFNSRVRVLTDSELCQVWWAAKSTPYPFGPLVQMLILTGQRLREVSSARWSEIDDCVLVVPAGRMKAKLPHAVPLTGKPLAIIAALPHFQESHGQANDGYLFTTTNGKRPISGFSKMKKRLDQLIEAARIANGGKDPRMPRWTLHDLRRTVRTRMSSLGVLPLIAELVIAHKQTGISAVYDLHTYDSEKRAALKAWEDKLFSIVKPLQLDAADSWQLYSWLRQLEGAFMNDKDWPTRYPLDVAEDIDCWPILDWHDPDWRNPHAYPPVKTTKPVEWAWNFWRRNAEVRMDWTERKGNFDPTELKPPQGWMNQPVRTPRMRTFEVELLLSRWSRNSGPSLKF